MSLFRRRRMDAKQWVSDRELSSFVLVSDGGAWTQLLLPGYTAAFPMAFDWLDLLPLLSSVPVSAAVMEDVSVFTVSARGRCSSAPHLLQPENGVGEIEGSSVVVVSSPVMR